MNKPHFTFFSNVIIWISGPFLRENQSSMGRNRSLFKMGILKIPVMLALMGNYGLAAQFGDFTYITSTTSVSVTGYTGTGGAVVIPGTINGLPVNTIGHHSFMNKGTITSVTIPESVTRIEYQAFQSCGKLASVNFPAGVTHIGNVAFQGCSSLTSISLPSSVTSIGFGPFANCVKVPLISVDALNPSYCSVEGVLLNKSQTLIVQCPAGKTGGYVIPSSVIDIGDLAFQNSRLTSVAIGNGITSIGTGTFSSSTYLTSVVIPSSVTSVKGDSFMGCSSLTSIAVDAGNPIYSSLNGVVFNKNQTNLVIYPCGIAGTYAIPNTVISIGVNAFSGCYKLTGITIPTSVTTIGEWSFSSCSGLAALNMPSSITGIGSGAFAYCTSLTSVAISGNVTKLGTPVTSDIGFPPHPAFPGCSKLMSITIAVQNRICWVDRGLIWRDLIAVFSGFPDGCSI